MRTITLEGKDLNYEKTYFNTTGLQPTVQIKDTIMHEKKSMSKINLTSDWLLKCNRNWRAVEHLLY